MNEKQYYIDIVSSLAERTIKRLWITIILLVILLFGSNAAWIYYESQWQTVETLEQDVIQSADNGVNRFVGGDYYGLSESNNEKN